MIDISLLIPTTKDRKNYLESLLHQFRIQTGHKLAYDEWYGEIERFVTLDGTIEILIDHTEKDTIGKKRNRLLAAASGNYLAFFDSDDSPSPEYISTLREGVLSGRDCISLRGIMTVDGMNPEVFEHSIRYSAYKTNEGVLFPDVKYERFPNHISCIKSSIAKQFKFPEINWSEDTKWATKLFESGLIKTEYYTDKILYHYLYRSRK